MVQLNGKKYYLMLLVNNWPRTGLFMFLLKCNNFIKLYHQSQGLFDLTLSRETLERNYS